jgi:lysozyme family protein
MRKIMFLFLFFIGSLSFAKIPKIDSIEAKKYPVQYLKSMEYVLLFEGGWFAEEVTNYGVMQPIYDKYRNKKRLPNKSVRYISIKEVYDLYYNMYYLPSHCDKLTPIVAFVQIDCAINFGLGGANKLLKRAVGLDGSNTKWNDSIMMFIDPSIDREIALNYVLERKKYRYEIIGRHPEKKKYLRGWLSRDSQVEFIIKQNYPE